MALFSRKTKPAAAEALAGKEEKKVSSSNVVRDLTHILKHARITEKASMHQANNNIYTFDIAESATKRDIIAAVRMLYKVTPLKVAVVQVPTKVRRSMRSGKVGVKRGGKKAYVYLKKDETINIA